MPSDDQEETGAAILKWAHVSEKLAAIGDVELAILKNHVVLEGTLKSVLARRLKLSQNAFDDLQIGFPKLLEIATAGVDKPHLVGALRALNAARVQVAHRVDSPEVSANMATFVQEVGRQVGVGMQWPTDRDAQLTTLQKAAEAAGWVLLEVVAGYGRSAERADPV